MIDVQNMDDKRNIAIQNVGIRKVWMPFLVAGNDGKVQSVTACIEKFTVDLPAHYRGTHMSRFVEILHNYKDVPLNFASVDRLLEDTMQRLNSKSAYLKVCFKYFMEKTAPVSEKKSLLDINCAIIGSKVKNKSLLFTLETAVPVTSLCPCSKEISDYGAHNQRSIIKTDVRYSCQNKINIEYLAALIEKQASSNVYPILKREDEKYVTETAYDNPKFVEDILRDTVLTLRGLNNIDYFFVECENFESIHNHNAYASYEEYL